MQQTPHSDVRIPIAVTDALARAARAEDTTSQSLVERLAREWLGAHGHPIDEAPVRDSAPRFVELRDVWTCAASGGRAALAWPERAVEVRDGAELERAIADIRSDPYLLAVGAPGFAVRFTRFIDPGMDPQSALAAARDPYARFLTDGWHDQRPVLSDTELAAWRDETSGLDDAGSRHPRMPGEEEGESVPDFGRHGWRGFDTWAARHAKDGVRAAIGVGGDHLAEYLPSGYVCEVYPEHLLRLPEADEAVSADHSIWIEGAPSGAHLEAGYSAVTVGGMDFGVTEEDWLRCDVCVELAHERADGRVVGASLVRRDARPGQDAPRVLCDLPTGATSGAHRQVIEKSMAEASRVSVLVQDGPGDVRAP